MKKVLVYRSALLNPSEVWIAEQLRFFSRWEAVLVGQFRVPAGSVVQNAKTVLLGQDKGLMSGWKRNLRYQFDVARRRDIKFLRAERASLIHIHFGTEAVRAWPLARALGIPVVVTLHGFDINNFREWWEAGQAGFFNRSYPKRLLELSRRERVHFLAVSEHIRSRAIEFGISEDKVSVCHLGVDTDKFVPSGIPLSDRREILFVGRLIEKKGCRYLLEAFSRIQPEYPDIHLVIVGTGKLELELRQYAGQHGLSVEFRGMQSHEQIRDLLSRSRMFCLPSIVASNGDAEGLPVSILEAQASGVPVITSAKGGVEEGIEDGVTGFSHKEKDVAALENAIRRLLVDRDLLESMGREARSRVLEKMNIRDCTARLERFYDSALEQYQHG